MSMRHDVLALEYRVKHFLSSSLDPLVTLWSNPFTQGKIASEYDATFERYRSYVANSNIKLKYKALYICIIDKLSAYSI